MKLAVDIAAVHRRSRGTYGSVRGQEECRAADAKPSLVARQKRRFRCMTDSKHALPLAPNVLDRQFQARAPKIAWVTDVTYITTDEGWMYLPVIVDLYSGRVVGWAASDTNDRELALAALHPALSAR